MAQMKNATESKKKTDTDSAESKPESTSSAPTAALATTTNNAPVIVHRRSDLALSLSKTDDSLPDDMIQLGTLPYKDYFHLEAGNTIEGELIAMVRRMGEDDDGNPVLRQSFIVRTTAPCICARTIPTDREYEIQGREVKTERGTTKDVYTVPTDTLVAFDVKPQLYALAPVATGKIAAYIKVICVAKVPSRKHRQQTYWQFKMGARPLTDDKGNRIARDTSLDFISDQATFQMSATKDALSDIPFLSIILVRAALVPLVWNYSSIG